MSQPTPGTPSLLRAINDRAALRVLLDRGPLTRPELGALTGLSKPTASQLLLRLQEAGLVVLDGIREGLPGRTAELYRINAGAAHVAALDVTRDRVEVAVADLTGSVVGMSTLPTPGRAQGDVVDKVRTALAEAWPHRVNRVVIGIQGAVDPGTGRLGYAAHIPGWHIPDLVRTLSEGVGTPVDVENDVNLVALAERAHGKHGDFVLLWVDSGIGSAIVLGDRLHRGATGGAGEVGYMPAVGAPTARDVGKRVDHGFQALAGGQAVLRLLRARGIRGTSAAQAVERAVQVVEDGGRHAEEAAEGLREIARRLAMGLASITAVLDPEVIVLAGGMPLAGGETLRAMTERELHALTLPRPPLRLSAVGGNPVLAGALHLGLDVVRDEVFGSKLQGG